MEVLAMKMKTKWLRLLGVLFWWLCLSGCNDSNLQSLGQAQFAQPPQTMSIAIMNYAPQPGNAFKDLFVSNFSVKAAQGQLLLSTSRDGLPDTLKQQLNPVFGFVPGPGAYSVNPGFSDLLLDLLGVTATQESQLVCSTNLQQSSSNDAFIFPDIRVPGSPMAFIGLRDCEKDYLGLNPQKFDNNGNGIPDYLKIRCSLNPRDAHDYAIDGAADGVSNYDKCKEHIPIDESSTSQPNTLFAYHYKYDVFPNGTRNLYVSNIPILNGGQDNFIAFYLTEMNLSTKAVSLYTAFTILGGGSNGLNLKFNYWATSPANFFNQEVVQQ